MIITDLKSLKKIVDFAYFQMNGINHMILVYIPVKMFLSRRQAGYSNRQQRLKLQGPPEESGRSKQEIFCCRWPAAGTF